MGHASCKPTDALVTYSFSYVFSTIFSEWPCHAFSDSNVLRKYMGMSDMGDAQFLGQKHWRPSAAFCNGTSVFGMSTGSVPV